MNSKPIHKASTSLSLVEVDRLNKLIQNENSQNLATAVVQLFETKQNDKWIEIGIGALLFIKDELKKTYYFSLYSLKNKLWEQELFMPFEYLKVNQTFHVISADNSYVGINFSIENEASKFYDIVITKINEYNDKYEKIYKYMVDSSIRKQVIKTLKDCNCDINEENIKIVIDYKLTHGGFEPAVEQPSFDLKKEVPNYKPKPPIDAKMIKTKIPSIAGKSSDAKKLPPLPPNQPPPPPSRFMQVPIHAPPPPPNRKAYENPSKLNLKLSNGVPQPPSYTPPPPPLTSKQNAQKTLTHEALSYKPTSIVTETTASSMTKSSITLGNEINPPPPNFKAPPAPFEEHHRVRRPAASAYENPLNKLQNQETGGGRDDLLQLIRDKNFHLKPVNTDRNSSKESTKKTLTEKSGLDDFKRIMQERRIHLANDEYMRNDVDSDCDWD